VRGFEPAGMRPGAPVFRAVAMLSGRSGQLDLFRNMPIPQASGSISLEELFEAYASCRKHKRCTASALAFEVDYEHELCRLLKEINCGEWKPGRVAAFIVDRPVKREILASPFRDRIVHHLLHAKLNPLFERAFIYDSYSCRTGKGTLLGIRRLERFIRSCSWNHTHPVFVLKIDIRGFFMNISRSRLYALLEAFLLARYTNSDLPVVLALVQKVVFHDPVSHCVIRGRRSDWTGLPDDKSMFRSKPGYGLPIGNLTSQVFANFYLNGFDHFMKHDLGLRWYGRYVDDMVVVHHNRQFLDSLIPVARDWLLRERSLVLHPQKTRVLNVRDGVPWLGTVIKQGRTYIANRIKGNCICTVNRFNQIAENHKPNRLERRAFQASLNSYFGLMRHYATYRLRRKLCKSTISSRWQRMFRLNDALRKVVTRG